jgi:hypothetical protein
MSRVKIHVTQDDIDKGIQSNCVECPVARALNRAGIKGLVASGFVSVNDGDTFYNGFYAELPRSASRFINRFDKGWSVKPFDFFLNMPDGVTV